MKRLIIAAVSATMVLGAATAGFAAKKPPVDGAAVYKTFCEGCHGAIESSTVNEPVPGKVNKAIAKVADMNSLKQHKKTTLKAPHITAACKAIKAEKITAPPPPPVEADGPGIYYLNCMKCHASLPSTDIPAKAGVAKKNITAEIISNAINKHNADGKNVGVYTADEINALTTAIKKGGKPGNYVYNDPACSKCHNGDGSIK